MRCVVPVSAVLCAVLAAPLMMRVEASTGPIPLRCDRACLERVMDQFLEAVVAHDPKRLPLSADVKYTENNQVIAVGDGFWKTAQGVGNYKHYFADPEAGQVAFMGTMREADSLLLFSQRLRIQLGRITEIDSVFPPGRGRTEQHRRHGQDGQGGRHLVPVDPAGAASVAAGDDPIADAYFTSVQKNDGKGIHGTGTYPFTNDCHRIENGAPTTNVPRPPTEKPGTLNLFSMDCLAQFKMGLYYVVQNIHGRRYPLVDAERGMVWAHCVFDQGTVNEGVLSDGTKHRYTGSTGRAASSSPRPSSSRAGRSGASR